MADTSGQAEIRGLNIDKLAKGFADEDIIIKKFVTNSTTSARQIRWYKKNAGILSGATPAGVDNVAELAKPFVLEQAWSRTDSYVRKYFVESPFISFEDIKDSDPDILAGNIRDLTRAISYKVDQRIWDVLSEDRTTTAANPFTINVIQCSGGNWSEGSGSDPIRDIMDAKTEIRSYAYDPEGGSLLLNSTSHSELIKWLINTKGSNIPAFSSEKVRSGVVMGILGLNVSVTENVTDKYGMIGNLAKACTWKSFVPITARTIEEVGMGLKIRVWEEGEALLTDPRAVCLLSGCGSTAIA